MLDSHKENHSQNNNYQLYILLAGFVISLSLSYLSFTFKFNSNTLVSVAVINVILGILFEIFRIGGYLKHSLKLTSSIILIFCIFLTITSQLSSITNQFLDNIFLIILLAVIWFFLVSAPPNNKKININLTEGITLLQSIAFIYWASEHHVIASGYLETSLFAIAAMLILFSTFHSITRIKLTKIHRLILSIWSYIAMLIFSIDYSIRMFSNKPIESASSMLEAMNLGLQYFLFGVACIYIVNTIFMLLSFSPVSLFRNLPLYGTEFQLYKEKLRKSANFHTKHYSSVQVHTIHSWLCIALVTTFFYANHLYNFMPRHVATWLAFSLFPIFINLISLLTITKQKAKAINS